MFCPLCKAEFREGFPRCSDCGLTLVSSIDEVWKDPPVILCGGGDSVDSRKIQETLREVGIACHELITGSKDGPIASLNEKLISVLRSDLAEATRLVKQLSESSSIGELEEVTEEPVSDSTVQGDSEDGPDPDLATVEVWSGTFGPVRAAILQAVLGSEINFRFLEDFHELGYLLVDPRNEVHAHQIIQEVLGGLPPPNSA